MTKSLRALLLTALLPALFACGGGGGNSALLGLLPGEVSKPSPNTIPVANAGLIQNVNVANLVTLDGTASRDANNATLTYLWQITSKPAGSAAVLSSASSAKPTFTADLVGIYIISLVVNDGKDNSLVSSVSVSAAASLENSAPVANAGLSQNVALNTLVRLDGTASTDANLDTLTYRWSFLGTPTGSKFLGITSTSPAPTFTPDVTGSYVISLIVNDGKVDSKQSAMTVNVSAANSAPVAVPGSSQNVSVATLVTLDGSASSDANFDFLTYRWNIITKPTGSTSALSSLSSSKPTFTPDKAGVYVVTLIVNDGKVDSEVAVTSVTASLANSAPVANAGNNQTVLRTATVTLSGASSTDANAGDILTYKWTLTSKPTGSTATLSSGTGVAPTFVADLAGVYVATLMVNDGKVDSNVATVAVTAGSGANSAPVAAPGSGQSVSVATLVTLDGSASSDANFDFLTYRWNIIIKPTGSTSALSSLSSSKPTFTPDKAGVYVVTLIVNDGKVDSEVAVTSVTASLANSAPVANAGNNQTVLRTATVTLSGASSTDANVGDILTYKWTITSKPTGSTATLSSATAVAPTFVADLVGVYVATLMVNDGKVDSNVATVAVTAN